MPNNKRKYIFYLLLLLYINNSKRISSLNCIYDD